MTEKMPLYEMMYILRKRRNLNCQTLADQIGVKNTNYAKREQGVTNFTLEEVAKLLDYLQFDSCVLFEGADLDMADRQLRPRIVSNLFDCIYGMNTDQLVLLAKGLGIGEDSTPQNLNI